MDYKCMCEIPVVVDNSHESVIYCRCGGYINAEKPKVCEGEIFDITEHEWSCEAEDCHILFNNPSWAGDDLQIEIPDPNGNYSDAVLIREHAIAIAKHFKLTAEDLK